MAKIKGPLLSARASGRFARVLSFRDTVHGPVATRFHYPGSRNLFSPSQAQLDWRALYGALVEDWRALSQSERDQWDSDASPLRLSGWALYVRDNISVPPPVPITETSLTNGSDLVDRSTYTTASITPSSDSLVLLSVLNNDSGNPPVSVSGNGLTWIMIDQVVVDPGFSNHSLWRSMGTAPTIGSILINFSAVQDYCIWQVMEFSGVDTSGSSGSGAVVQSVLNTIISATSLTVSLAPFTNVNNATFGSFGVYPGSTSPLTFSPGAGFTEIYDDTAGTWLNLLATEWRNDNDQTVDGIVSYSSDYLTGFALEIASA